MVLGHLDSPDLEQACPRLVGVVAGPDLVETAVLAGLGFPRAYHRDLGSSNTADGIGLDGSARGVLLVGPDADDLDGAADVPSILEPVKGDVDEDRNETTVETTQRRIRSRYFEADTSCRRPLPTRLCSARKGCNSRRGYKVRNPGRGCVCNSSLDGREDSTTSNTHYQKGRASSGVFAELFRAKDLPGGKLGQKCFKDNAG